MFWADELAAQFDGPQVVNDSKTPVGHRAHRLPARRGAPRRHPSRPRCRPGRPSRFLYGVDDLDPMDSQALLTPDAVERYMGVPLAHVPAPAGSAAPSYARYFVGELFMGTFRGLGVEPEIYWMSELYARRLDGPLDPPGAGRRGDHPRHLPARQPRRAAGRLAAGLGHLRGLRAHRHHAGHRLGRPDGRLRLQARLRRLGRRLRPQRARGALRRARQAALQRGLGRQVEPLRHHHRGLRQGPRHEGRQPRPQRRRQPGGLPPRAAGQRALRVPQRRRPQDEHLEGQRRRRPRDGRPAAAGAHPLPLPAPQAAPGPRVRPGG